MEINYENEFTGTILTVWQQMAADEETSLDEAKATFVIN